MHVEHETGVVCPSAHFEHGTCLRCVWFHALCPSADVKHKTTPKLSVFVAPQFETKSPDDEVWRMGRSAQAPKGTQLSFIFSVLLILLLTVTSIECSHSISRFSTAHYSGPSPSHLLTITTLLKQHGRHYITIHDGHR
jgi:hypothetical protein